MAITIKQPDETGLSREVVAHGNGATLLLPGRYFIRPLTNASGQIVEPVCAGLLTTSTVPVGEHFEYVFDLVSDCNLNGVDDATDILANPGLDVWPLDGFIDGCYAICILDFNRTATRTRATWIA
jgi:hypothetical protein